jgi:hypothetical protein
MKSMVPVFPQLRNLLHLDLSKNVLGRSGALLLAQVCHVTYLRTPIVCMNGRSHVTFHPDPAQHVRAGDSENAGAGWRGRGRGQAAAAR